MGFEGAVFEGCRKEACLDHLGLEDSVVTMVRAGKREQGEGEAEQVIITHLPSLPIPPSPSSPFK